jgi:hypothetical protein
MQPATTLTIKHPDDTVTRYRDVKYTLHRDMVHVVDQDGKDHFHDAILTEADHQRAA